MSILIYGATGYTGRLCAAEARTRGIEAILAGRNRASLEAVAGPLGYDAVAVDLADRDRLAAAASRVRAVLNVAGPYGVTAAPMVEACLAAGVHYLDLTGDPRVLERHAATDDAARERGVMLLPGAGFAVVASDCLLAYTAARAVGPDQLSIVIDWRGGASRGTVITTAETMRDGTMVSRGGSLVPIERPIYRDFPLDDGLVRCVAFIAGDLVTARISTGVGNITAYFPARSPAGRLAALPRFLLRLMTSGAALTLLRGILALIPPGPGAAERQSRTATLLAVAEGGPRSAAARLTVPHPYALTARVAVDLTARAAAGEAKPGYQTPSAAFGADYVLGFEGVTRIDLDTA